MDHYEFYREQHNRTLDHKTAINTSLSTPIGILMALVGALFYAFTSFEYSYEYWLSSIFILLGLSTLIFLAVAIFHLAKALSDFHDGYTYQYLALVQSLMVFETVISMDTNKFRKYMELEGNKIRRIYTISEPKPPVSPLMKEGVNPEYYWNNIQRPNHKNKIRQFFAKLSFYIKYNVW